MDVDDFLKNEEVQRYVKQSAKTVATMIYNEIYPYVWLLCIYSVLLFLMVLMNFVWVFDQRRFQSTTMGGTAPPP
jgi:hypothetical protein